MKTLFFLSKSTSVHSNVFALLIFVAVWLGLACFSGSLFSGFHIVDDHEIIAIQNEFNGHAPLCKVMKREIGDDLSIRLRPLYYADRIFLIRLFGDNFLLWSTWRALLAVLTSFLLFLSGRSLGLGVVEAALFPLLALIGTQSNAWFWRGPAEAPAMLMFAVSLYCIAMRSGKTRLPWDALLFFVCRNVFDKRKFCAHHPGPMRA